MSDDKSIVNKAKLYRVQKWQEENKLTGEEYAFSLIGNICNTYGLGENIKDDCCGLYQRVREGEYLRGHSVEVGVCVVCFITCRVNHLAYNVDDMISVVHVGKKEVYSMYRSVKRGLELTVPNVSTVDYLVRYGKELDLEDNVLDVARGYVVRSEENGLGVGKNPLGVVAGALYVACKDCGVGLTQREIVDVVGISEVVLRNRVREFV